jgi:hypothetical protein
MSAAISLDKPRLFGRVAERGARSSDTSIFFIYPGRPTHIVARPGITQAT